MFSFIEVLPLVLLIIEAIQHHQLIRRQQVFNYRLAYTYIIGAAFWNFVGAGVFGGGTLNAPLINYYEMAGLCSGSCSTSSRSAGRRPRAAQAPCSVRCDCVGCGRSAGAPAGGPADRPFLATPQRGQPASREADADQFPVRVGWRPALLRRPRLEGF